LRRAHNIPADAVVAGYMGRITSIKGINELAGAWRMLRESNPQLHLLLGGRFDAREPVSPETLEIITTDPRIHLAGFVNETAPCYAAMDLLVLPSYHEGFPVVLLEASAMELPIVATSIPGNVDAVADKISGRLVRAQDVSALRDAIQTYIDDPEMRRRHGCNGRARVLKTFQQQALWDAIYSEYMRLLSSSEVIPRAVSSSACLQNHL
jgi:glycosyltransferase involved in cell wall biosynthesis